MEESNVITTKYDEVYGILLALGNNFISKIPKDVFQNIANHASENRILNYDLRVSLNVQGVSKEALAIVYQLYSNYWCTNEKEKEYLKQVISNNEIKLEKEKSEKYNKPLFSEENKKEEQIETIAETQALALQDKWYQKLFKKLFHKK